MTPEGTEQEQPRRGSKIPAAVADDAAVAAQLERLLGPIIEGYNVKLKEAVDSALAMGRQQGMEEASRRAGLAVATGPGRRHLLEYDELSDLRADAIGRCLDDNGLVVPTGTADHHEDEHVCTVCGETYTSSLRRIGRKIQVLHPVPRAS